MAMVVIYGTPTCGFCLRAKKLAERNNLSYEYKDITYEKFKHELVEQYGGEPKTVPQIWWNKNYIGGYEEFATEVENTRTFGDGSF